MNADLKLSRFESFLKLTPKFAPNVCIEFEGVQLVAIPDRRGENCKDCYFYSGGPAYGITGPMPCAIEPPSGNDPYACGSRNAGAGFGYVTVRFFEYITYAKMRIKGEL